MKKFCISVTLKGYSVDFHAYSYFEKLDYVSLGGALSAISMCYDIPDISTLVTSVSITEVKNDF